MSKSKVKKPILKKGRVKKKGRKILRNWEKRKRTTKKNV